MRRAHIGSAGFTLVELLATLALLVIVLGLALPGMQQLISDNRSSTSLNRFRTALAVARHHAVSRRRDVAVCKRHPVGTALACSTQGNWNNGWLVMENRDGSGSCTDADNDSRCDEHGGRVLDVGEPMHASLQLAGSGNLRHRLPYNGLGMSPGYMGRFRICDRAGGASHRELVVYATGRVRLANRDDLGGCGE